MMAQIAARIADLKQEYRTGEAQLRELVQQEVALRETLLRISGAIQVLEELMGQEEGPAAAGDGVTEVQEQNGAGSGARVLTVP